MPPSGVSVHRRTPDDWDDWLRSSVSGAGFGQSSAWAAMAVSGRGSAVRCVEVIDAGTRVAGALLTLDRPRVGVVRLPMLPGTMHCIDGPVAAGRLALNAMAATIEELRRELGAPTVVLEPPPGWALDDELMAVLPSPWDRHDRVTAIVSLERPLDDVWAGLAKPVRRNVERCRRQGITVREMTDRAEFLVFLDALHRRVGVPARWRTVRDEMMWDLGAGAGHRFFVAERDGAVLATLGTRCWAGRATEIASGRTPEGMAAALPMQDILHWEVISAHHQVGDRQFDLAGFNPMPTSPKERGIRQFKSKWGGEVVPTPKYERASDALLSRAANGLQERVQRAR